MLKFLVKRLDSTASLPVKSTPDSACFDLEIVSVVGEENGFTVHTGLAVALPPGYCMLIFPRSGLSTKLGLTLRNGVGVIDSDYRGEILVKLNSGFFERAAAIRHALVPGSRIAQAMIIQLPEISMEEVFSELPSSIRGTGGFGSTGT
jgi:dUTP pyrophosphatase